MAPADEGVGFDDFYEFGTGFMVCGAFEFSREVKRVPTDNAVFNQPVAGFGDFLVFFTYMDELTRAADNDGTGEAVRELNFVELLFDRLAQADIGNVAQNEQRFDDLPESLGCLVERMLTRIRIEPTEYVRGSIFFKFDGCDQPQQLIPVLDYQRLIDVFVWIDFPAFTFIPIMASKVIQALLGKGFDPGAKRETQQIDQTEDCLGIAMRVRRVQVAFDNVVMH
ncbi:MAG: hypothetical protein ABJL72_16555 [Roseobacter sp.]